MTRIEKYKDLRDKLQKEKEVSENGFLEGYDMGYEIATKEQRHIVISTIIEWLKTMDRMEYVKDDH